MEQGLTFKVTLSKDIEELRFQITEEQERITGAGKTYGEVGDALEHFIEIERAAYREGLTSTHQEERLITRRRVYQLLRKFVDKIVFNPAPAPDPENSSSSATEYGTIHIRLTKGMREAVSLSIVVIGKKQKDSRGYLGGDPAVDATPHVILVDESWPPKGRILSGKALGRMLFPQH